MVSVPLGLLLLAVVSGLGNSYDLRGSKAHESPEERAWAVLKKMTLDEKIQLMQGVKGKYIGNVRGISRLNIPDIRMHDGPQGFRVTKTTGPEGSSTCWPSALSVAATWDSNPDGLMFQWADAMAQEFKGKGANVMLGPGVGIARVPTAGRNFEYLCGEEPTIGAKLVAPMIKGIHKNGIMGCIKHWVNNEIETDRMQVSANVTERTRFELYYPPFEAAVQAGVLTAMCSYNRIGGEHACQNPKTLNEIHQQLGYKGFIMSDWGATHSTVQSINSGLDQELPVAEHFSNDNVDKAINDGEVNPEQIDDAALRILSSLFKSGLVDTPVVGDTHAVVTSPEHTALARTLAAEATVLLKNEGAVLPIVPESDFPPNVSRRGILVVGDADTFTGTGSGRVIPEHYVTPTEGIRNAIKDMGLSDTVPVTYLPAGISGRANFDDIERAAAIQAAKEAGLVVVVVATSSGEGHDRPTLSLGALQDSLVTDMLKAAGSGSESAKVCVSVNAPGAVLLPWASQVPALLLQWLPGQEWGNALADVLFGKVNPSARLHVTMPNKDNEVAFTSKQFPGIPNLGQEFPTADYSENLFIGYRYYEAMEISPVFSFGHGLSFSHFTYGKLTVEREGGSFQVHTTVTNNGKSAGKETAQLYVRFPTPSEQGARYPASVGAAPPRALKAFVKTSVLKPGEMTKVTFNIDANRDMSVYDSPSHQWAHVGGSFVFEVGASSVDIRAKVTVNP